MKLHHIGYLVSNIKEAMQEFYRLGYELNQDIMHDNLRHINICFMSNNGTLVELIEPGEGCKLFTKLHKKIGNAPYHIAYITEHFITELENLQDNGYLLVQPPEPAPALENKLAAFLMNNEAGLIEVIEG